MSLILVAYEAHPRYRLVVAANRDEFHRRDTALAAWWPDAPGILAGRDYEEGGTWLGITRQGRFAAVSDYRDPKRLRAGLRSRGLIVSDFLEDDAAAMETLRGLAERPRRYNPFAVLMDDGCELGWCSNRVRGAHRLTPGIYGLSNHLLDTPWYKVASGKAELAALIEADAVNPRHLLAVLASCTPGPQRSLPHTGVGEDCERWLSPRFVLGNTFGTRSSTVLLVTRDGEVELVERSFDAGGCEIATSRFTFDIERRDRQPSPAIAAHAQQTAQRGA
jgi:uncharacterized protein with NRDE domain